MRKISYISIDGVNPLQTSIMQFVDFWVHEKKTPIPLQAILSHMKQEGVKEVTTVNAINILLRKGYIRRAIVTSNKSSFVQLRRV